MKYCDIPFYVAYNDTMIVHYKLQLPQFVFISILGQHFLKASPPQHRASKKFLSPRPVLHVCETIRQSQKQNNVLTLGNVASWYLYSTLITGDN